MISFQLTVSVLWVFMTLSWAHITPVEPNLKVMTLTPSTDHLINNVTQNVSLECAFNSRVKPWQTSMTQILRLRILKLDIKDRWDLMAEIGRDAYDVRLYDNILGRGQVRGDMWTSYLNITWPIVTGTTFGKYLCDVLGYDANLKYISEESNNVILTDCHMETEQAFNRFQHALDRETEVIDEQFKLMDASIIYDKQDMENKVNDLYNTLMALNESLAGQFVNVEEKFSTLYEQVSTLNQSLDQNLQSTEGKLSGLHEQVSTLNQSLDQNLQSIDEIYASLYQEMSTLNQTIHHTFQYNDQQWPDGTYSLLAPLTGCPRQAGWRKGYHKIHTESNNNQNKVSSPSHLPNDTLTSEGDNHFVTLNFCSKVTSTSDKCWPTGSYCINHRGDCPPQFNWGRISMDRENTGPNLSSYGGCSAHYNPASVYTHYYAHYCCRRDGPATTPIDLPTDDPFYLYRFRGTCQSVTNMTVSNEYIIIDTEDAFNGDKYETENHPDGSLNPVRLELCYYTPK